MIVNCGTFHGGIAATTPTGSRRTTTSVPSTPVRRSSHGNDRAMPRNASICIHGAGDCARFANDVGEPISSVISSAISPSLPAYRFEKFWTISMRSSGLIRGHGPESNARRAAATAASMSAVVPSGTVAITCSECGDTTWIVSDEAGAAHSPSMKSVDRSSDMSSPELGSEAEEVGEAGGVVAADREVLEQAPALGTALPVFLAGRAPDVVDAPEHEAALHGVVIHVV